MAFSLPDILRIERAGRAMASQVGGGVETGVATSLAGAAALAAIRHIHNRGFKVRVAMTDQNAAELDVFSTMLEVVGAMDVPIQMAGETVALPQGEYPVVISGLDQSATSGDGEFLVAQSFLQETHPRYWDGYARKGNVYLRPAEKKDAKSAQAMRAIDESAIKEYNLPGVCLMENAGIGATVVAAEMLESRDRGGPVVVLAGSGNNGGDGYVVARGLLEKGEKVRVLLVGDPLGVKGDARINLDILQPADDVVQSVPADDAALRAVLAETPLVVDAIFGTGLTRAIEGRAAKVIEVLNEAARPVLALDLPSGLDADDGEVLGVCVRAAETVTFAAPKRGLFEGAGPEMCGTVTLTDIGCPRELLQ